MPPLEALMRSISPVRSPKSAPEKIAAILPLQFFPQPADFTGPYVMLASRRNNRALSGVMINADAGLAIRGIRHVAAGLDL